MTNTIIITGWLSTIILTLSLVVVVGKLACDWIIKSLNGRNEV